MTDLINRRRIAVDWDGTCIVDHTWPEMGEWLPGAKEALYRLAHMYDEVVIHTLRVAPVELDERTPRAPHDQIEAIEWMLEEARLPWNVYVWTRPYKPPAEFYVDDRAVRFEGDWDATLAKIAVVRAERPAATNRKEDQMNDPITAGEALCAPSIHQGDPGDEQPFEHDSPYDAADANCAEMRTFETGATRNDDSDELDYEGFLSPLVLNEFARYMHKHRVQADGSLRASDNWQKGIPQYAYRKSLIRHVMDLWLSDRGSSRGRSSVVDALCAIIFNAQGYLYEILKHEDSLTEEEAA